MARPNPNLARSLAALTIGVQKQQEKREEQLAPTRLGNMVQAVQTPFKGEVGRTPTSTDVTVNWPYPFLYAPAQTDSNLQLPHFAPGIELLDLPPAPVIIIPQLHRWLRNDDEWTLGCVVGLTCWVPNAKKKVKFTGILHTTISGYGAPTEDEDEDG